MMNATAPSETAGRDVPEATKWGTILLAALAGGMGWGIRGQYGHETGAMIAGLLVCLVLVGRHGGGGDPLTAARAAAWGAIATGFGGSMTYGQTLGLTHNPEMIGHYAGLAWGMLGLALKGGVWIGFTGAFLGLGLSGVRWRPREWLLLMLALLGLFFLGVRLFNEPFDPGARRLPWLYFSASWHWTPDAENLRPRREVWGGLWLALLGLLVCAGRARGARLAVRLAGWGMAGGALGFPLGQALQAGHAWHPDALRHLGLAALAPHLNWWGFMETAFGAVWGGVLGCGVWRHRRAIRLAAAPPPPVRWSGGGEWIALGAHLLLLLSGEFLNHFLTDLYLECGLLLGLLPVVAVAAGRRWPWWVLTVVTLTPIAGKTLRALAFHEKAIAPGPGALLCVALPLAVAGGLAVRALRQTRKRVPAARVFAPLGVGLTWIYFLLNFAVFRCPWPWEPWTRRTPNALVFFGCALGLTWGFRRLGRAAPVRESPDD